MIDELDAYLPELGLLPVRARHFLPLLRVLDGYDEDHVTGSVHIFL